MTRLQIFDRCTKGPWTTSGLGVQWRFKDGVLAFQCTRDRQDWLFNFFAGRAEIDGDMAHAGFASLWASVLHEVAEAVGTTSGFQIEGYSQGAALATLAYRYFDKRGQKPHGNVFGSPKVFAEKITYPDLENIQAHGDLVSALPFFPWFHHTGTIIRLGKQQMIPTPIKHTPEEYRKALS